MSKIRNLCIVVFLINLLIPSIILDYVYPPFPKYENEKNIFKYNYKNKAELNLYETGENAELMNFQFPLFENNNLSKLFQAERATKNDANPNFYLKNCNIIVNLDSVIVMSDLSDIRSGTVLFLQSIDGIVDVNKLSGIFENTVYIYKYVNGELLLCCGTSKCNIDKARLVATNIGMIEKKVLEDKTIFHMYTVAEKAVFDMKTGNVKLIKMKTKRISKETFDNKINTRFNEFKDINNVFKKFRKRE